MSESPSTRRSTGTSSTLWVVGEPGPVVYAVCRIGREIGHSMIAVDEAFADPDVLPNEPWVEGVEWRTTIPDSDPPRALIRPDADDRTAIPSVESMDQSTRIVRIGGEASTAAEGQTVVLQAPPLLGDDGLPLDQPAGAAHGSHRPIPVDQLAIALLRAALEPGHAGSLSPERVAELGDAMYIK